MSLSMAIKKRYPGFTLDVALEAGEERVALLGASGCGKSLTLRCIAGVETPDEGRIVVNGVTFFDSEAGVNLSPQERKTALLFQNYQLFPHMTVLENVCAGMAGPRLGLGCRMEGEAARRESCALRFLEIFGVSAFADRFPTQLSGGQQRRACPHARRSSGDPHVRRAVLGVGLISQERARAEPARRVFRGGPYGALRESRYR